MDSFGWTYDHITLSRLDEYREYMQRHPPTHMLVAAYLGYEPAEKDSGAAFLKMMAAAAQGTA